MTMTANTYFDTASLSIEKQKSQMVGMKAQNDKQAKETAEDFEAFFLSRTMESMFETVSTEGMFGGGNAERIYRSMLINEYGKNIAQSGGIGVADHVMNTILELQEKQSSQN
ncbi:MAG: rod-binding protein [Alphaproteobacteria bacterium]|nr:rod-binding protein [Alphaproteobacteria bacterium]